MESDPDLVDYLREIGVFPLLTAAEELMLARQAAAGDAEARTKLILSNLRLVVAIAKQYTNSEISFLELVTEGNYGLVRAVDHFKLDKETRFATYATWWIKQAMRSALKSKNRQVRIPDYILKIVSIWQKTAAELEQRLARKPSTVEIAAAAGVPVSRIPAVLNVIASQKNVSEDLAFSDTPLDGMQPIHANSRSASAVRQHDVFDFNEGDARKISCLLACVDPRSAAVLRWRYGVDGAEKLTLEEIGGRIPGKKLTRERVRQIEIEALKKILAVLDSEGSAC